METDDFAKNEICDGGNCMRRDTCVRYMGNIDIESGGYNPYIVFVRYPIFCPYYLDEDNGHYPQLRHNELD